MSIAEKKREIIVDRAHFYSARSKREIYTSVEVVRSSDLCVTAKPRRTFDFDDLSMYVYGISLKIVLII